MFNVTGTLKVKNNELQISERFKKREFILTAEASSQYPQHVQFQLAQDKCSLLNDFNVGDELKVHFNLRGREWEKDGQVKYFNTLDAWKIERTGGTTPPPIDPTTNGPKEDSTMSPEGPFGTPSGSDDLPF